MNKEKRVFVFLCLIPLVLFLAIFDYKILNPNYLDWFQEDTYQHWLGWSFFRETSFLQFPILKNYAFGMDSAGSLIYSDSIPIIALLLRPFSDLLDFHFQYFGWWIALCVFLQYMTAFKIMNLVSSNNIFNFIASCFFIFSPVFLFRYNIGHESLMGQWLVLIGLYFFLKPKRVPDNYWLILILGSLLVHGYFFAMISIIYFVVLLRRYYKDSEDIKKILLNLFRLLSYSLILMYIVGYFTIEDVFHGGYGGYRLNILSIFNPYGSAFGVESLLPRFSLFKATKNIGDFEGFNYLGFGMLMMLSILLINGIINFKYKNFVEKLRDNSFTIILISIITLYALSNRIAFGPYELFQYNVPEIFKLFTSPFRASGRMFWPAYYIIYILILFQIFKRFQINYAISIVLLALTLTVYDIKDHVLLANASKGIKISKIEKNNFKDLRWKKLGNQYTTINYVFPVYAPNNWQTISYFAAKNKLNINGGYWARHNEIAENRYAEEIKIRIKNNTYDKNAIYYFNDTKYWNLAKDKNKSKSDLIEEIDNLRILAPDFFKNDENEHKK